MVLLDDRVVTDHLRWTLSLIFYLEMLEHMFYANVIILPIPAVCQLIWVVKSVI